MTTRTKTITSDAWITAAVTSTILCDGTEVNKEIDEYGTNVTLRVVSKTFSNEYGDATETYSDSVVKAIVSQYTESDWDVKEGMFKGGDIVATFKGNEINAVTGNRVNHRGNWYEIKNITYCEPFGVSYAKVATLERI